MFLSSADSALAARLKIQGLSRFQFRFQNFHRGLRNWNSGGGTRERAQQRTASWRPSFSAPCQIDRRHCRPFGLSCSSQNPTVSHLQYCTPVLQLCQKTFEQVLSKVFFFSYSDANHAGLGLLDRAGYGVFTRRDLSQRPRDLIAKTSRGSGFPRRASNSSVSEAFSACGLEAIIHYRFIIRAYMFTPITQTNSSQN